MTRKIKSKSTHVERIVETKVIMAIEMPTNKVINLCLGSGVQVLEFVHRLELDDVETVGDDAIRFTL
jgi:hypothetical protein